MAAAVAGDAADGIVSDVWTSACTAATLLRRRTSAGAELNRRDGKLAGTDKATASGALPSPCCLAMSPSMVTSVGPTAQRGEGREDDE